MLVEIDIDSECFVPEALLEQIEYAKKDLARMEENCADLDEIPAYIMEDIVYAKKLIPALQRVHNHFAEYNKHIEVEEY